jgi:oligosaccharide translocation protein RFT1
MDWEVRAMLELKTNVRVRAEGLGITAKSFVTFLVLFVDSRRGNDTLALVAFALGQLAYAVVVFGCYVRAFGVPWVKKSKANSKSQRCVCLFAFE